MPWEAMTPALWGKLLSKFNRQHSNLYENGDRRYLKTEEHIIGTLPLRVSPSHPGVLRDKYEPVNRRYL